MLLVQVQVSSRYNAVFSLDGPKAQMLLIKKIVEELAAGFVDAVVVDQCNDIEYL